MQIQRIRAVLVFAGLLVSGGGTAHAASVQLLADNRIIEHRYDSTSDTHTPAGPFEAETSFGGGDVLQSSEFFPNGEAKIQAGLELALWSANGGGGRYGGGDNVFDFTFSITAPQPMSFSLDREYFGLAGRMDFEATLYREGMPILGQPGRVDGTALPPGPFSHAFQDTVAFETVLDPATYRLVVSIYGLGDPGAASDGAQGYAFLTMHFVPEPGTALLVGLGLLGLGACSGSRSPRAGPSEPSA